MDIRYSYKDVPTLAAFASSDARIRGINGPFRSGKSSASVAEIVRRGTMQRPGPDGVSRTRWLVIRNTFSQLEDSTIRTTFMWLPPEHFGKYTQHNHTYVITALPGPGGCKCEIEIWFRALDRPDHVRNLLSVEVTGAWVNEAREIPWAIVEALDGRIGMYPSKAMGGPTWFGMWLDTNPPDTESDWYKFFVEKAHDPMRVRIFQQPSGLSAQAENLNNLPSPNYYRDLAYGKRPEWIAVYIEGKYGFLVEGKPIYPDFSEHMHLTDADPMPGITIIRSWDYGLCYSDDTEVLTDHGWKLFKDVDEKVDRAASRDPITGRMAFAPIGFKIAKPYKGDMLEWASTELNMLVTPEHRVPFTYRDSPETVHWESAEWLADHMSGHHYVDLTSTWEEDSRGSGLFELGDAEGYAIGDTRMAEFMGLYLSEGSTDGKRIAIYQREPRADMARIIDAMNLPWKWVSTPKASGWHLYYPALARYLKTFGLAGDKFVPDWIKALDPGSIQYFIWAYTMGDGHVRTRKNGAIEHTIYSVSRRMVDDMQDLAQRAGWNSSLRVVPPQTSYLDGRKIVGRGGYNVTFKKRAERAELHRRNFRRVAYDGMVYCLNVPWHTLYVRRKGKPHWNGNTPACAFSQLWADARWLTFDEMTSTSMSIDKFSDDVLEHCARAFRGEVRFEDWGDPAGQQRAQTDARTCFDIQQAKGIRVEGSLQNPQIRWESVSKPLRTIVNGQPQFMLHRRCTKLHKGFLGGYHRRQLKVSGATRYADEAEKNEYSHIHDALQYGMAQYFAPALIGGSEPDDYPSGPREDYAALATRSQITGY